MDEIFELIVDYSRTLKQMVKAGKYGQADHDIHAVNFPIPAELIGQKIKVFTKLFHFDKKIFSEKVAEEMEKDGYRPATPPELLALGEVQPELQNKFPIVALGLVMIVGEPLYKHRHSFPCLTESGRGRRLRTYLDTRGWGGTDFRFLGVRK